MIFACREKTFGINDANTENDPIQLYQEVQEKNLIPIYVVVVVVVLLFYVHGKHLRSCRDGQLI